MKYTCTVISVADINLSRKFYEDLFEVELYQNYGINISFTCGLSLQQEFDWLINLPKEEILEKSNNIELCFEEENFDNFIEKLKEYPNIKYLGDVIEHSWGQRVVRFYDLDGHLIEVGEYMKMVINRFFAIGLTIDEISIKMSASVEDLEKLLNS
ncbi:glyoxalase [Clostridium vincentii]|uniref:Fosfomycin resistance protein FosB n=1 Tax=Clostridium vincentii TaxID=52704 RepID=A0A2T0BF67_9CLOT|nr:glyoxalase [Clostridium vincentii]PRR82509.1 fosfomycin resistance protein FosB [Clostridium vincentii]